MSSASFTHSFTKPSKKDFTWIEKDGLKRTRPMRLISASWGRTGTASLAAALNILGLHDVYHYISIFKNAPDAKLWRRALDAKYYGKGEFTRKDWDALLGDCEATTDWPAALFYEELMNAYPEAKIVLTIRDPEKWWKSYKETVLDLTLVKNWQDCFRVFLEIFGPRFRLVFGLRDALHEAVGEGQDPFVCFKQKYIEHNIRVQQVVPPERLLLWGPADGWEPLCKFLDLPIPAEPLPHVNDTKDFKEFSYNLGKMETRSVIRRFWVTGVCVYGAYKLWQMYGPALF